MQNMLSVVVNTATAVDSQYDGECERESMVHYWVGQKQIHCNNAAQYVIRMEDSLQLAKPIQCWNHQFM